ncbi:MAG: hypothetical protein VB111_00640 [Clostridiaceae bacterium]|nr:hypothetical protein [Clostridiaceae bacterium]
MGIPSLPTSSGYYLNDKLPSHVLGRSARAFDEAEVRRNAISSPEELAAYAEDMRSRFIDALGGIPYDPEIPLHAEVTGIIHGDVFDIEKVIYQSRPSVYVTANLYIPHERRTPCGAVLFNPGHSNEGKTYTRYQGVARSIASAGLIVLLVDPVGQGERHSYIEPSVNAEMQAGCTSDHQYAGHQIMLTGDAPVRYFIADARRGIDYLLTRPEVDPDAIGLTGSSGGGTMTCNMMVCEPRAKAAAPGTFLTTRRAILYSGQPQDAEQIWMGKPGFVFDHQDVLACFAPKPCLVLCDDADFFPIEGSIDSVASAKRLYALCGAEDAVNMTVDHSEHAYTKVLAARAAAFFACVLNGEDRAEIPSAIEPLPERELNCTPTGQVRSSFPDARFLFHENLDRVRALAAAVNKDSAVSFIRQKVDAFRKPAVLHVREYTAQYSTGVVARSYLWFTQGGLPNYGVLLRDYETLAKTVPVVVCLFDRGTDAIADQTALLRKILRTGAAAFVLDTAGIGKCSPDACNSRGIHDNFATLDVMTKNLFFLGDSLCALRLFDLERVPDVLKTIPNLGDVSLCARGNSCILANLYALLHPETAVDAADSQSVSDVVLHRYYEDYDLVGFLLPGIAPYAIALGF